MTKYAMHKFMNVSIAAFSLIVFSAQGFAQGLDLFQNLETSSNSRSEPRASSTSPLQTAQSNTTPAFILRSASKFGDNYHTSLIARDGGTVSVGWTEGSIIEIDGHPGYSVINVGFRTVSLKFPSWEACIESIEKGVSCTLDGIAILSLSNVEPLESMIVGNNQSTPTEEAALAMSLRGPPLRRGLYALPTGEEMISNFDPTPGFRIAPEDVPEGMRVIKTPNGDRLVPN